MSKDNGDLIKLCRFYTKQPIVEMTDNGQQEIITGYIDECYNTGECPEECFCPIKKEDLE
jgi:hypothetical protein